jgi:hypothetical protein
MASLLVETGWSVESKAVRVVLFIGVLDRYLDDRWLLYAGQVVCEWWVGLDGHAHIRGPFRPRVDISNNP